MINFDATKEDVKLITEISKKAIQKAKEIDVNYDLMDCQMDLAATHLNGTPLDLQKLKDIEEQFPRAKRVKAEPIKGNMFDEFEEELKVRFSESEVGAKDNERQNNNKLFK